MKITTEKFEKKKIKLVDWPYNQARKFVEIDHRREALKESHGKTAA